MIHWTQITKGTLIRTDSTITNHPLSVWVFPPEESGFCLAATSFTGIYKGPEYYVVGGNANVWGTYTRSRYHPVTGLYYVATTEARQLLGISESHSLAHQFQAWDQIELPFMWEELYGPSQ